MDKKTYFTESVKSDGFATYPFTEGYNDPEYPDYDFKGWKINGVTYTPAEMPVERYEYSFNLL